MASQDDPIKGGIEGAGRAIGSALAVRQNKAQIANIEAQTAKTNAERHLLEAETPSRINWWEKRPGEVEQRIGLMGHQASIASATANFLEETYGDRVKIVGLDREQAMEFLTQLRQEIELRGLDRAPLEAQARFAKSYFGSNIAPAIGSAQGVVGILTGLVAPFLNWFNARRGEASREREGAANRANRPKGESFEVFEKNRKGYTRGVRRW